MKTKYGRLDLITGNMFSGKTEKLLQLINRAEYKGKKVLIVKYRLDTRYDEARIVSHFGRDSKAEPASSVEDINKLIETHKPNLIAIDELQFFKGSKQAIEKWLALGIDIIASALSSDVWAQPWPNIGDLMCLADKVYKLTAICLVCKKEAAYTQLLTDTSKFKDGSNVLIGGKDLYEPRCRNHFTPANPIT